MEWNPLKAWILVLHNLKKKKKKSDLVIWIDSGLGLSGSSLVLHVLLKKKRFTATILHKKGVLITKL